MATTKIITEVTDLNAASSTNGLKMPTGGAYSGTPTDGMVRNDTTGSSQGSASTMQHYNGTEWKNYENLGNTFTTDFLVVAGGGGGGGEAGGGGGSGGLRTSYGATSGGGSSSESSLTLYTSTVYTITIGRGGAGSTSNNVNGENGYNSVFATITSEGGGGGAGLATLANSGGSGGGGSHTSNGNSGTSGQGFAGGNGNSPEVNPWIAGGGGGALEAGNTDGQGFGGDGLSVSITGSLITYAGGASGASRDVGLQAGTGGGGNGAVRGISAATNGTPNTGGGGGGGDIFTTVYNGANGGSGVVILRYPTADVSSYAVTGTLDTVADTAYPVANTAYYKLEGGSGTTVTDSSGNGYNGTATSVTYAAGRFGQAAVFNGSTSQISFNNTGFPSTTMTVSAWIKPSSTFLANGISGIVAWGDTTVGERRSLVYYAGGQIGYSGAYASGNFTGTTVLPTEQWSHVAFTLTGGTVTLYINGAFEGSGTVAVNAYSSTTAYIGTTEVTGTNEHFNGSIDQVRIFSSALSAANVTSLYNEGTVVESTDGTDSILQFIGGTGTVTFS